MARAQEQARMSIRARSEWARPTQPFQPMAEATGPRAQVCDTPEAKKAFQDLLYRLAAQTAAEKATFRLTGWRRVLSYHQAANRVDYVIRTVIDHIGKERIEVPKELSVDPDDPEIEEGRKRCIRPIEELRSKGEWLKGERAFLLEG